jgi:hypothetical protein
MSRRRVLLPDQERALELWYRDYERIGTVDEKCREYGISEDAFRDAIKRQRSLDVRSMQRKLAEAIVQAEISQLIDGIPRGTSNEPEAA